MNERRNGSAKISRRSVLKGLTVASSLLLLEQYLPAFVTHLDGTAGLTAPPDIIRRAYAAMSQQTVFAQSSFTIAPGATLTTTTRATDKGWVEDVVIIVDLANPAISLDLINTGTVAEVGLVTTMARAVGAVAAINADFFDQGNTNAPLGAMIQDGALLKSVQSNPTAWKHVAIGTDRVGGVIDFALTASFSSPRFTDPQTLAYLNVAFLSIADSICVYTPEWSVSSEPIQVPNVLSVRFVTVSNGVVTAISTATVANQRVTIPAPPSNGFILLGRDAAVDLLGQFELGDEVSYSAVAELTPMITPQMLVGGNIVLVEGGIVPDGLNDVDVAARSAIGFSADGKQVYLVAVDGKQVRSRGLTIKELGDYMLALGAQSAINLDGGGSTQIVGRRPGSFESSLINSPSDLGERGVPVAIGVFAQPGDGQLAAMVLAPALNNPHATRLFSGLRRSFRVQGLDNALAPAPLGSVAWTVDPATALDDVSVSLANTSISRTYLGGEAGDATLTVTAGSISSSLTMTVLGAPTRIATTPSRAVLANGNATLSFAVVAFDPDENSAPVEVADVTIEVDTTVATITADVDSNLFIINPNTDFGSALAIVQVGALRYVLAITIGTEQVVVADLNYADQAVLDAAWSTVSVRAVGSLAVAQGREAGKNGVQINFDFSGTCDGCSTGTRATYLRTRVVDPLVGPERLALPGQPLAIGAWVKAADGFLPWMRCQVYDTDGAVYQVDFTNGFQEDVGDDWFFIEAQVPAGVSYPLYFRHIYPVETSAARTFISAVTVAELQVALPPELDIPTTETEPDVLLDVLDAARWKFAIINDLHFIEGENINNVLSRRALQQLVAAEPEFVIVAGDLVDDAEPDEFAFAKEQLTEIWGEEPEFPVYIIPGNHELLPQSSGTIDNYLAAGFETRASFDYQGVRFILLNTSNGRLYAPEFEQLLELKAALDDAATDATIKHVLVVGHHPTVDALPPGNRQFSDRNDAAAVDAWMAEFARTSGKGIVYYSGHAHYANFRRSEGVPYIISPAAGKVPYAGPGNGGFNGWSLFGVQPDAPSSSWLRVSVKPLIKAATLRALDESDAEVTTLTVGETVRIDGVGTAHERNLAIPLRYPALPEWQTSANLLLRRFDVSGEVGADIIAQFDPVRAELRALSAGTVTLSVTAEGAELASLELTIAPAQAPLPNIYLPIVGNESGLPIAAAAGAAQLPAIGLTSARNALR
jgi:exopolysaccharide biosynthesis protein/3',5'-cyclic AMP phosphodiesterase CpdA